jgi:hypothetical protein
MELHEQVTSPDLSNKLHQLGVTAPSVFWRDYAGSEPDELEWAQNFEPYYCEDNVNCYSVAELGEMLPKDVRFWTGIKTKKRRANAQHLHIFHGNGWMVNYTGGGARENYTQHADTEADAHAKMLIYLIENKIIQP